MIADTRSFSSTKHCIVIHPCIVRGRNASGSDPYARLDEAVALVRALGLSIDHAEVVNLTAMHPGTLFGAGTLERLGQLIAASPDEEDAAAVSLAFIDSALSPVQQRNLERRWRCKVLDRTALILEIFGERARTAEGELQVELAALNYQKSRLVRTWTHLERQRGGFGFLGGPGEAQIETDRRLIRERISKLRQQLAAVRRTRALHRRARKRVPYPVVALVGYTNAGKSTLFNRLTQSEVFAADQVFATLDPTMRLVRLPSGRNIILSDTVGFISELPIELIEAFRATLEEVTEADFIVHVRDISQPDSDRQKEDVNEVLASLGLVDAESDRLIEVLNKADLLSLQEREPFANRVRREKRPAILLSAIMGEGCDDLLGHLDARLAADAHSVDLQLPPEAGAELAWLYAHAEVIERRDSVAGIALKVRLSAADAARFFRRYPEIAAPEGLAGAQ